MPKLRVYFCYFSNVKQLLLNVKLPFLNSTCIFCIVLPKAATEMAPSVEESITSPVKNLQKKTDLFQLQKVVHCFSEKALQQQNKNVHAQTLSSRLQTLLEMNESRRSKKLSPFEILRNESLEFIDNLVKYDLSLLSHAALKYNKNADSMLTFQICYLYPGATCLCQSLRLSMKSATTVPLPLWDATSTLHPVPPSKQRSLIPTIICRYNYLTLSSV